MQRKALILSMLMAFLLVLAACGDDDNGSDDSAANGTSDDTAASTEVTDDSDDAVVEDEADDDADSDGAGTAEATDDADATTDASDEEEDDASGDESDADGGGNGEVEIEHAQGTTTVSLNPETVAVFDYSVIDTLDELGVEIAGVPQGNMPPFLADFEDDAYENIGTLFEPDYERVNALDPDLIVVAGRSSAVYEELADMAPTIDLTVDAEDFLSSYEDQVRNLGAIFEQEDEVDEVLAEVEETVERIQSLASEQERRALIVMVSGGEVTAYGPGSRFGMIHDLLGVSPVEEDIEAASHGDAISFEFIQERDPDILYVLDRDSAIGESGEAANEVLDNELVHSTTAWTEDAVFYLDSSTWYLANAGLTTFPEMLAEIEESLQ